MTGWVEGSGTIKIDLQSRLSEILAQGRLIPHEPGDPHEVIHNPIPRIIPDSPNPSYQIRIPNPGPALHPDSRLVNPVIQRSDRQSNPKENHRFPKSIISDPHPESWFCIAS